jgi:hypothetical protein
MQGANSYNGAAIIGGAAQCDMRAVPPSISPTNDLTQRIAEEQERSRYLIDSIAGKLAFVRGGGNCAAKG